MFFIVNKKSTILTNYERSFQNTSLKNMLDLAIVKPKQYQCVINLVFTNKYNRNSKFSKQCYFYTIRSNSTKTNY